MPWPINMSGMGGIGSYMVPAAQNAANWFRQWRGLPQTGMGIKPTPGIKPGETMRTTPDVYGGPHAMEARLPFGQNYDPNSSYGEGPGGLSGNNDATGGQILGGLIARNSPPIQMRPMHQERGAENQDGRRFGPVARLRQQQRQQNQMPGMGGILLG